MATPATLQQPGHTAEQSNQRERANAGGAAAFVLVLFTPMPFDTTAAPMASANPMR